MLYVPGLCPAYLPSSFTISAASLKAWLPTGAPPLSVPVDGEVILYCACPNEATAVKVAQKLRKIGYKRIRPLQGGIDAWIEAGLEVER